ncbi:polysaccharide deacetylase family protein [Luminiphilus sp.]|nr:polysaccharide deacetylase family protein [Luminiphilus sp.]
MIDVSVSDSPVAISLNFDSLNEAYGFPQSFTDPSFEKGFDRIARICANHNFPLSIYVIGKDLLNPARASAVKEWASQGHEIGNHSWSHHFNLGNLSCSELKDEVTRSHDLISEVTGEEPKGFISPCWSTSGRLIEILSDLRYLYDSSAFPSLLMYPMVAKVALNHWRNPSKGIRALLRKDWLGPLKFPNQPFFMDSRMRVHSDNADGRLLILPLPAKNRISPAIWHTLGFIFGWDLVKRNVRKLSATREGFYYLIHPADFLEKNDLDESMPMALARMDLPLSEKLSALDQMFSLIKDSGRPVRTMKDVAKSITSS